MGLGRCVKTWAAGLLSISLGPGRSGKTWTAGPALGVIAIPIFFLFIFSISSLISKQKIYRRFKTRPNKFIFLL
jgi:hypothetical protein